uniref:RNA-binding protein 28 n=1 Tax=Schistocephalus solidus TaxID=70667 RepID=A0A0X3PLH5_SCHSO
MKPNQRTPDVCEGRTLFIRNVSFDADEHRLQEFFSAFGQLEFVKIVKDKLTQHPRGTAFVKFVRKEDADRVLLDSSKAQNSHKFIFAARQLIISLAVTPSDVKKLQEARASGQTVESVSSVSSGRNLHLARVGMIRAGTAAAEGLTPQELTMRESLMRAKQAKLRDPSIFISPLRLCLRNIPTTVDEKTLRKACQRLAGPTARITECRIMRDLKSGKLNPKSLGYAFVAFDEHKDALKVLQVLNNNNAILGGSRRPIVEFSLENSRALEKKRRRAEKSRVAQDVELACPSLAKKPKVLLPRPKKVKGSAKNTPRILPKKFGAKIRHNRSKATAGRGKNRGKTALRTRKAAGHSRSAKRQAKARGS